MSAVAAASIKKKYLSAVEVSMSYGISRSSLYCKISRGSKGYDETYPKPIKIGRSTRWCDRLLEAYYAAKLNESER